MKIKSVKFRMIAIALLSATMPFTAKAQDKVEASVGADFVRGNRYLAGAAVTTE